MAEIQIERKHSSPWVWLVALALLAFLAWFVANSAFGRRDRTTLEEREGDVASATPPAVAAAPAADAAGAAALPPAVSAYLAFAEDPGAGQGNEIDPKYAQQGIARLAAAIEAVAVRDTVAGEALRPQLAELRERANSLQRAPNAVAPALEAREAFLIAASLIDNMRERRAPNAPAEVTDLTSAAKAIQAERPLLDQIRDVQQFFSRAGVALRAVATPS